jgi:hypothetical protein
MLRTLYVKGYKTATHTHTHMTDKNKFFLLDALILIAEEKKSVAPKLETRGPFLNLKLIHHLSLCNEKGRLDLSSNLQSQANTLHFLQIPCTPHYIAHLRLG